MRTTLKYAAEGTKRERNRIADRLADLDSDSLQRVNELIQNGRSCPLFGAGRRLPLAADHAPVAGATVEHKRGAASGAELGAKGGGGGGVDLGRVVE